jgi:bifunctional DNA-binding transcriptional regulator/antitoxin component of YhaV-PrlF toxin-antitoxin module
MIAEKSHGGVILVIFTKKTYENKKGYLYIPVIWREEFNIHSGLEVGIDCYQNSILVIDKTLTREYKQIISNKGFLTIPHELRERLTCNTFQIIIEQKDERIILAPK